jgi:hypothetical protein
VGHILHTCFQQSNHNHLLISLLVGDGWHFSLVFEDAVGTKKAAKFSCHLPQSSNYENELSVLKVLPQKQ